MDFSNMPCLGLRHRLKTDAPYACIEPWPLLPSRKNVAEGMEKAPDLAALKPQHSIHPIYDYHL